MHKKFITLILSSLLSITLFRMPAMAASFSMSSSTQQVNPGSRFTVSVGGDCIGRVNISVSNGTASTSAVWVEENFQTVTITAGSSETVTVTATPEAGFSDSDANEYRPGSRSVSVKIIAPSNPGTTQPTTPPATNKPTTQTPANNTNTKRPQTNNQTPASNNSNNTDNHEPTNTEPEAPTKNQETADDEATTEPEVSEETPEATNEDICPECPSLWLPWSLASFFGVSFLVVTGVLIYILYRQSPKQKHTHEKTA